jgi:hypothetical protein
LNLKVTRRELLVGGIATAVFGRKAAPAYGAASQPATRVCFDAPNGACDCHTHVFCDSLIDVAPRHSALVGGFSNTIATIPGIVGVTVTDWLLDVTGTYSAAFILTARLYQICGVGITWLY